MFLIELNLRAGEAHWDAYTMSRSHSPQRGLSAVACGGSGPLNVLGVGAATLRTPGARGAPAPAPNGAALDGAHTDGFTTPGAAATCPVSETSVLHKPTLNIKLFKFETFKFKLNNQRLR